MGNQYYTYGGTDFTIPKPYEREGSTNIGTAQCGTPAGYAAHRRHDIPLCDGCRAAEANRAAERRAAKKAAA